MKKILSLMLAFSFFAAEASFMERVKKLPETAMERVKKLPETAKEFLKITFNAANSNKKKAFFTTVELLVTAHKIYTLGKPEFKINPTISSENSHFSLKKSSFWGIGKTIINKYGAAENITLRPIKYLEDFFNGSTATTLFILELLKRLP
jgi:hypothetical protein